MGKKAEVWSFVAGLGFTLIGLAAPLVFHIPPSVARGGLLLGIALIVLPGGHLLWGSPQVSALLRSFPRRISGAIRGFRSPPEQAVMTRPAPPSVEDVVAVDAARVFYRVAGRKAATSILEILDDLRRNHLTKVTFSPLLAGKHSQLQESMRDLEDLVADNSGASLHQVQQGLVRFLKSYQAVVAWTHESEKEGIRLMERPFAEAYSEWESRHKLFFERLTDLLAQQGFAQLMADVGPIGLAPVDAYRFAVLRARAQRLLETASDDQREFLSLFCVEEIPMQRDHQETYLAHRVYRAGEALVAAGFLQHSTLPDGLEQFEISQALAQTWQLHSSGPYPRRRQVTIDPKAVWGSGNSGGGA